MTKAGFEPSLPVSRRMPCHTVSQLLQDSKQRGKPRPEQFFLLIFFLPKCLAVTASDLTTQLDVMVQCMYDHI